MSDSKTSFDAVRLAVRMAVARRRPVRLVHALAPTVPVPPESIAAAPMALGSTLYEPSIDELRYDAERLVTHAEERARSVDPRVRVSTQIVDGGPSAVLVAQAHDAAMVVVGYGGAGRLAAVLLGSVPVQVIGHASCPVVVARGEERQAGPVVVGVADSPTSALTIAFAAEEAALRGAALLVVHAWTGPTWPGPGEALPRSDDVQRERDVEGRLLAESVARLADTYPDVRLERRLVHRDPIEELTEQSTRAQLVVVGAHGHGPIRGLLLGSVSQALIQRADCPVAVVRATATATATDTDTATDTGED